MADHYILALPCHAEGIQKQWKPRRTMGAERKERIPDLVTLENLFQTWTALKFPSFSPEIWKSNTVQFLPCFKTWLFELGEMIKHLDSELALESSCNLDVHAAEYCNKANSFAPPRDWPHCKDLGNKAFKDWENHCKPIYWEIFSSEQRVAHIPAWVEKVYVHLAVLQRTVCSSLYLVYDVYKYLELANTIYGKFLVLFMNISCFITNSVV